MKEIKKGDIVTLSFANSSGEIATTIALTVVSIEKYDPPKTTMLMCELKYYTPKGELCTLRWPFPESFFNKDE